MHNRDLFLRRVQPKNFIMKNHVRFIVQLLAMILPASLYARVITSEEHNGLAYNKGYVYDFKVDNIFYTIHEDGVFVSAEKYLYDPENNSEPYEVVINSSYNVSSVIIPETVKYGDTIYTVRGIDDVAFKGCDNIESVDIPLSARYIGRYAFSGCANLYKVYLPDEICTIQEMAFSDCVNLKGLQLPDCLTYLNYGTFKGCVNMQIIYIPKSVAGMDEAVFSGCVQLQEIHITSRKPISFINVEGENNTFYGVNRKKCTIYVSSAGGWNYTFDKDWGSFNNATESELYSYGAYDFVKVSLESVRIVDAAVSGDIIIPQTLKIDGNEYYVRSIDNYAFSRNSQLQSVVFPEGLITIRKYAFCGCNEITSLTFPSSIEEIEESAFRDCNKLTSVYIKKENPYLILMDDNVFSDSMVCNLYVPDKCINDYSSLPVWSCFNQILSDVIGQDGLLYNILSEENKTAILVGYNNIHETMDIPSKISISEHEYTVVAIKDHSFSNCTELTSITIPTSIETIGIAAFSGCSNLKEINLPSSLYVIEEDMFRGCKSLESFSFPANLKIIGNGSFRDCKKLQSLYIPNGVIKIGGNAFDGCGSLKKIYIPTSVSEIDFTAFQGCNKIDSIFWNTNVPLRYVTRACNQSLKYCSLGDEIKIVEDYSFMNCKNLSSIILSENVEKICDQAFYCCTNLSSIVIPQKVEYIGVASFKECSNLHKVVIEGDPIIDDAAFFWCDNLDSIILKSLSLPKMTHSYPISYRQDYFTENNYKNTVLSIPEGAFDAYAASDLWSRFCSLYTQGYDSELEKDDLYYTYHDTGISLGAKTLRKASFKRYFGYDGPLTPRDPNTGGLQPRAPIRDLPEKVSADSSDNATYHGNITIPESVSTNDTAYTVTGINYYAFLGCTEIESVHIPESVSSLGYGSFAGCSGLREVNIPSCVTKIPNALFYECSSLSNLEIPEGVTTIGYSAFCGCTNLTQITIPAGVELIDMYAFAYCSGLKRVIILGNPMIDETAFIGCGADLEIITTVVESHQATDPNSVTDGAVHYGIDGRRIQADAPGLHIIKRKDGTVTKALVR